MKRLIRLALLLAVASMPLASSAIAGSATSNFNVTATVVRNCSIAAANLAFGNYDPIVANPTGTPLNVSSTVTVACTRGVTATIGLNAGNNSAQTGTCTIPTTRAMGDGAGHYLCYEIYQDSGHTTVWGNSGNVCPVTGPEVCYAASSRAPTALSDYGQIPGGEDVPVASYTDTVLATITF